MNPKVQLRGQGQRLHDQTGSSSENHRGPSSLHAHSQIGGWKSTQNSEGLRFLVIVNKLGVSQDNKLRKRSGEFCCLFSSSRDSPCIVSLLYGGGRLFPEMPLASENSSGGNSIKSWPGMTRSKRAAFTLPPGSCGRGDAGGRKGNLDGPLPSSFISQRPCPFFSQSTLTFPSPSLTIKRRKVGRWG